MLSQVKNAIKSLKNDTFHEHFIHYVMEVQDSSIDEELKFLKRKNSLLSSNDMIKVMNNLCEGMITQ